MCAVNTTWDDRHRKISRWPRRSFRFPHPGFGASGGRPGQGRGVALRLGRGRGPVPSLDGFRDIDAPSGRESLHPQVQRRFGAELGLLSTAMVFRHTTGAAQRKTAQAMIVLGFMLLFSNRPLVVSSPRVQGSNDVRRRRGRPPGDSLRNAGRSPEGPDNRSSRCVVCPPGCGATPGWYR